MLQLAEGNTVLRPLQADDAASLAALANNKNVWNNLRDYIPHPYSLHDAVSFIQLTLEESPRMTFAIEYARQFCGVIGLVAQPDVYKQTAEIGYWLGEPYWHQGIATTAVKLLTAYGLHQLRFIRIQAGIFEQNIGSMRVLAKNGYAQEGIFRKSITKNGTLLDEYRFAKTR